MAAAVPETGWDAGCDFWGCTDFPETRPDSVDRPATDRYAGVNVGGGAAPFEKLWMIIEKEKSRRKKGKRKNRRTNR